MSSDEEKYQRSIQSLKLGDKDAAALIGAMQHWVENILNRRYLLDEVQHEKPATH